jgi:uncharacterized membrane protein
MSEIKSRYPFLTMGNLLGGGFLLVAVFAWAASTAAWLGFAISIPLLAFGLAIAYSAVRRGAGLSERIGVTILGMITAVIAAWTIIASLVFVPATARWLIFASACAHVAVSTASLVIREITAERVVHHLEVGEREPIAAH